MLALVNVPCKDGHDLQAARDQPLPLPASVFPLAFLQGISRRELVMKDSDSDSERDSDGDNDREKRATGNGPPDRHAKTIQKQFNKLATTDK